MTLNLVTPKKWLRLIRQKKEPDVRRRHRGCLAALDCALREVSRELTRSGKAEVAPGLTTDRLDDRWA